jgi:hypothetical protein
MSDGVELVPLEQLPQHLWRLRDKKGEAKGLIPATKEIYQHLVDNHVQTYKVTEDDGHRYAIVPVLCAMLRLQKEQTRAAHKRLEEVHDTEWMAVSAPVDSRGRPISNSTRCLYHKSRVIVDVEAKRKKHCTVYAVARGRCPGAVQGALRRERVRLRGSYRSQGQQERSDPRRGRSSRSPSAGFTFCDARTGCSHNIIFPVSVQSSSFANLSACASRRVVHLARCAFAIS